MLKDFCKKGVWINVKNMRGWLPGLVYYRTWQVVYPANQMLWLCIREREIGGGSERHMKDVMKVSEMESNTSCTLSSLLVKATGPNQKGICLMDEFYPSNGYKHLKNENIDPFPKFFHPSNENGCYERFWEGSGDSLLPDDSEHMYLGFQSQLNCRSLYCIYYRRKRGCSICLSIDVQIQNSLDIASVISLELSLNPVSPHSKWNKNIFFCLLLWTQ